MMTESGGSRPSRAAQQGGALNLQNHPDYAESTRRIKRAHSIQIHHQTLSTATSLLQKVRGSLTHTAFWPYPVCYTLRLVHRRINSMPC